MKIQALTDKGKEAIQQHMLERNKLSRFNPQRIMYEKFFSEEIISQDPFILEVEIKNSALSRAIRFEDLKSRIEEAMAKNGAEPEDYLINE